METHFFRNASNRLSHDRADIEADLYADVCRKVADRFNLKPTSDPVVGLSLIFCNFTDGTSTIELAWDNWLCFTVTANDPAAEPLVRNIAAFLSEALPPKPRK